MAPALLASPVRSTAPPIPLDLPITWISAGDRPGQAVILGTPMATTQPDASGLTAWLEQPQQAAPLELPVLQHGNGTITLGLPAAFRLAQWQLKLCAPAPAPPRDGPDAAAGRGRGGAVVCTVPRALYAPDLAWTACDGAVCSPGAVLRLFGRRLAYDPAGCRRYNATDAPIPAGAELEVVLTPHPRGRSVAPVRLLATSQSCHEARFLLPAAASLGTYVPPMARAPRASHRCRRAGWTDAFPATRGRSPSSRWTGAHVRTSPSPALAPSPSQIRPCPVERHRRPARAPGRAGPAGRRGPGHRTGAGARDGALRAGRRVSRLPLRSRLASGPRCPPHTLFFLVGAHECAQRGTASGCVSSRLGGFPG